MSGQGAVFGGETKTMRVLIGCMTEVSLPSRCALTPTCASVRWVAVDKKHILTHMCLARASQPSVLITINTLRCGPTTCPLQSNLCGVWCFWAV